MKKICFVTTVSLTIRAFVLPVIRYLSEHTDWEITVICHEDSQLQEQLPEGVRYIPVTMQRGISVGGVKAMRQMVKIFRREKSPYQIAKFNLYNIDKTCNYIFTDADSNCEIIVSGNDLYENGLTVEMKEKRSSKLFFYKKV